MINIIFNILVALTIILVLLFIVVLIQVHISDKTIEMPKRTELSVQEFINALDFLKISIVQNWYMCKYIQLFKNGCDFNFDYYLKELKSYINRLREFYVLSPNAYKVNKKQIIKDVLIHEDHYDDPESIKNILSQSLKTMSEDVLFVCNKFASNIDEFIDAMCYDEQTLDNYIKTTFTLDCI